MMAEGTLTQATAMNPGPVSGDMLNDDVTLNDHNLSATMKNTLDTLGVRDLTILQSLMASDYVGEHRQKLHPWSDRDEHLYKIFMDITCTTEIGLGRTLAYAIPAIEWLLLKHKASIEMRQSQGKEPAAPVFLVLTPTRELCVHILNQFLNLSISTSIRSFALYSDKQDDQVGRLGQGADVLIAIPERLLDILRMPGEESPLISHERLTIIIYDEADRLLEQSSNLFEQIKEIHDRMNAPYTTQWFFSSHFSAQHRDEAELLISGRSYDNIGFGHNLKDQILHYTKVHQSFQLTLDHEDQRLETLLNHFRETDPELTLILCRCRIEVDRVYKFLHNKHGIPCTRLHDGLWQQTRDDSIRAFKLGRSPIMVATMSLNGRSVNFANTKQHIFYDVPDTAEEYIRCLGQISRLGHQAKSLLYYRAGEKNLTGPNKKAYRDFFDENKVEFPADLFSNTGTG